MNKYEVGDLVRCRGVFKNAAGTAVDPAAVFFYAKAPDDTLTEYEYGVDAELVKESTGTYYVDIDANAPGAWFYRFKSTGSGQAADEHEFAVGVSQF